jgi:hypothetical protein
VSAVSGDLSQYAVPKTLFLDLVTKVCGGDSDSDPTTEACRLNIPSKIEGVAFGQDVVIDGVTKHTLFIANDNDFLPTVADPTQPACTDVNNCDRGTVDNPTRFYVFAFDDGDLPGYVPQAISEKEALACSMGNHGRPGNHGWPGRH